MVSARDRIPFRLGDPVPSCWQGNVGCLVVITLFPTITPGKSCLFALVCVKADHIDTIGSSQPAAATNDKILLLDVLDWNIPAPGDSVVDYFGTGRIAVGPASGGQLTMLMDHERMPDGIEIVVDDRGAGRIYWTQMGHPELNDGLVQSANLDGSDVKTLYHNGDIHTPKQIAVDEVNEELYISDREGMRVHRCGLDGENKEVLVCSADFERPEEMMDHCRHCVDIAVDAANGKFYWTQKGPSKVGQGRIFRANINMPSGQSADTRQDIETLFNRLPEPIDLALDLKEQILYWTDRGDFPKGNSLNRMQLSKLSQPARSKASTSYDVLATHLHEAVGVKVDDVTRQIYVTDLGGCVYRYDIDGKNRTKLFEDQGVYTGIAFARVDHALAKRLCSIST